VEVEEKGQNKIVVFLTMYFLAVNFLICNINLIFFQQILQELFIFAPVFAFGPNKYT